MIFKAGMVTGERFSHQLLVPCKAPDSGEDGVFPMDTFSRFA